ncbi:DUF2927 domain-containing protein [Falsihalocynthiibacter sp. S25ZX9]|uniref:DUF2927 domain-containing protein n=1 Tax=Falsihalocynthiibacter sp. S25ZX9 TaxID=3240870 RepID=UPI00350EE60E
MFKKIAFLLLLSACAAPTVHEPTARRDSRTQFDGNTFPAMKTFSGTAIPRANRSNSQIAQDFLDLSFRLESGRRIETLSRFEGPITVRMSGKRPPGADNELARLLARIQREAGIQITMVPQNKTASINIETISRRTLQKYLPNAACFVVPRITNWSDYKRNRRGAVTDWTTLRSRQHTAIFIPNDVSTQEFRDCLHEELAQALGPLNDLYRLPDSVFNDDNFHTILTGFDMLILRTYYAPELRSGMTSSAVQAALPTVLQRLNPSGGAVRPAPALQTPVEWKRAIETALSPGNPKQKRTQSAAQAVEIAQKYGWTDTRRAFSHYVYSRMLLSTNTDYALKQFLTARQYYIQTGNTQAQLAHIGMQLAGFALIDGNGKAALQIADSHLADARASENAILLSTLLMIKSEALLLLGRDAEAQTVALDSLGWARYGFTDINAIRRRQAEISGLVSTRS